LGEIESALGSKRYKIITVTHVDTSTGTIRRKSSGPRR
jgi:aspartate aminotransferase-like enzyme